MLNLELVQPLPQMLVEHGERFGDKPAFLDDRRSVSYADLEARTRRIAGHLASMGVVRGDPVVIYMDNRVETAEAYLAATRAGLVGVCINPAAAPAEVSYMVCDSGARLMLTDEEHLETAQAALAGRDETVSIVVAASARAQVGTVLYEELATTEPVAPPPDDLGLDEVAWMLYTSGTTGRPKGVKLTQRSCLWVVAACWASVAGLSPEDRVLSPLPLFHSYALDLSVLGVFAVGATERIMSRFSTPRVLELLAAEPFTVLPGVPTMFQYLVNGVRGGTFRDHSLRACLSAGAIMPSVLNTEFERAFGVPLLDGYGITETSTMVTMNWPTGTRIMGSCGLPLPGVSVRLIDPTTGEDVSNPDEEGEAWVSGPNVMVGYHNRPEATDEVLQQGWYRTGDLARRDANGYLTISGRIKELIIRGGENIYPAEIETVLLEVPDVADAAVVARPHPELGEVPVAFVVPVKPGAMDASALTDACRRELAAFKVPEQFIEIDGIPRTGSGRIMRYRLSERLASEAAP